jgi:GH24 family phage-related lysozyme (muramidase)
MGEHRLSARGEAFIAHFEGLRTKLYNDPAGHCSIGVGHLVHLGRCNGAGSEAPFRNGISREEAFKLMRKDAARFEKAVNKAVAPDLEQHEFDALVSFAYNVGEGALQRSSALRELNHGRKSALPSLIMPFVHDGKGNVIAGLVRRRRAEGDLFAHADYDPGPGHSTPEGSSRSAQEVEAPHPSLQLRPGEAAHLREWAALVAIRDWPGYDEHMAIDAAAVQKWIDERCALLHKLIRSESAKDNKRLCRQQRLTALEHHRGVSLGPAVLPTAACTASEKAHIAMREAYIGFTSTSPEQKDRKLANLDWLVDRRRQVYALGEHDGWDDVDRKARYRCLSIATSHGPAFENWQEHRRTAAAPPPDHDDDDHGGDPHANGMAPRGEALRWLTMHRGITEDPMGSNTDRREDGIRNAQLGCARNLVSQPWCGVWCFTALKAAGVPGINARMAAVAFIEDDARAGRGPFRGWTTDRSRVLRGDLVVIGGRGVHVETVREVHGDGSVTTDGGNTGPGTPGTSGKAFGSFRRRRFPSEIHGFALVDYPDE